MFPFVDNINSYIKADEASGKHGIVAGGAGDGVEVTGTTIDRLGYGSASIVIVAVATLQASETLKLTVTEQQSADNSTWDSATSFIAETTYLTGESGGSTDVAVSQTAVNFAGKKRYVRYNITPQLSAGGTDTAAFGATAIKGGAQTKPAS